MVSSLQRFGRTSAPRTRNESLLTGPPLAAEDAVGGQSDGNGSPFGGVLDPESRRPGPASLFERVPLSLSADRRGCASPDRLHRRARLDTRLAPRQAGAQSLSARFATPWRTCPRMIRRTFYPAVPGGLVVDRLCPQTRALYRQSMPMKHTNVRLITLTYAEPLRISGSVPSPWVAAGSHQKQTPVCVLSH